MCYAIPVFSKRVAPRCNIANAILFIVLNGTKVVSRVTSPLRGNTWVDLLTSLTEHSADVLVCGGINRETRELVESRGLGIIDNVCCTADEAVAALEEGTLRRGFGFGAPQAGREKVIVDKNSPRTPFSASEKRKDKLLIGGFDPDAIDCLACPNRVCLRGKACRPDPLRAAGVQPKEAGLMLEAARDIALERERTLCRLSELIYFCLEMSYRNIGVAFCVDMLEAADILVRVLRRFFEVHPICCKVGGRAVEDPWSTPPQVGRSGFGEIACNPQGQAAILNKIGTDLNVAVGLCIGADCIFSKTSQAPVSTLFVKDKSLANNPIGALYSDYYLKEATHSTAARL
jgi:uncharacterized metal-binding protein